MADLEYWAAGTPKRAWIRFRRSVQAWPGRVRTGILHLPRRLGKMIRHAWRWMLSVALIFIRGDWATKMSFGLMGFGCLRRGRIGRGLLYLGSQLLFWYFFFTFGVGWLSLMPTLGKTAQGEFWNEEKGIFEYARGDNSMLILLYGIVTLLVILIHTCIYFSSVRVCYETECLARAAHPIPTLREEISDLKNRGFHRVLLFLPTVAVMIFTVLPLLFMIALAFTNYDRFHMPPGNLFTWVGLENFRAILGLGENALLGNTFRSILSWTLIWAFFATVTNYALGMILAILINRRGIRFKKFFRTVFVTTVAVPQFVSLLFMRNLLADNGLINVFLTQMGWIETPLRFLTDGNLARITVILVNMWVGIPYSMLITTGILMNIPADLYEASRIDGAGPVKQFTSITLPYVLFVTTPYLITQFVGNINNFNVIWLLTGGGPMTVEYYQGGKTDLLVTWLYRITTGEQNYKLASVIGIITFAVCAVFSLIVYSRSGSAGEEKFL